MNAMIPIGTLIKKMKRHDVCVVMTPPSTGPSAGPSTLGIDSTAEARARSFGGYAR
jgi:hypothetical protein